ncbi:MAG TPA: thiamine-phosphate kinase [Thermoanaerobaculia bacterium]|jgi:thiamine-monophosphate kinase
MPGEDELIAWLRRRAAAQSATGTGGELLGDDAAVLPERETWTVSVDTQIEGVHFLPGLDPATVAARLVAVNLSDLAAMGALPAYAFLALAAPDGFDHRRFFKAVLRAARRYGFQLAGGDLAASSQLTAVMTLLGRAARKGRWLRRGGARAGEALWLGGDVGESGAGAALMSQGATLAAGKVKLPASFIAPPAVRAAARRAVVRHLAPRPQLDLGRWLAQAKAGAAIDVSDGLARDLHRLCRESGTGAEIDLESLPMARGFRDLAAALDLNWRQTLLAGGEDYVLLFTLPSGVAPPRELGGRRIGRVIAGRGVYLIHGERREPLAPLGWDHLER